MERRREQIESSEQRAPERDSSDLSQRSCEWLWGERNSIFKKKGYCFKTPRAIAAFGNAGCRYLSDSDVPLSSAQRSYILMLKSAESQKGC